MRHLYTLLLYLVLPLVLLRLLLRSLRAPAYRLRWSERLGEVPDGVHPGGLWIHAVSVGEVQAVAPLVRQLRLAHPRLPVHITTTTPTGSTRVERLFGQEVTHSYLPYDLPLLLRRFLKRVRPAAFLMVETEIWPNLLRTCRQQGIPSLLANARLSARSARGYRRVERFAREVFALIDRVAAQSVDDAARFAALGVPQAAIEVTGSIKFDMEIPASIAEQAEVMRLSWRGRPVWVAASTHEGEDEIVLAAHARLLQDIPTALLVLVPRHPERFERVSLQVIKAGLELAKHSDRLPPGGEVQVYLGDTMGELTVLLGAADAAFFGGSLARVGGHNMLEAAAQGVPVCFGPHTFNFALISKMLLACGAGRQVEDAESLASVMRDWLGDASVRSAAGEAGRHMVRQNRGALARLQRIVDHMLPGRDQ